MKLRILALLFALVLTGCDLFESDPPVDTYNVVEGENSVAMTEVGNTFTIWAALDDTLTGAKVDTCYITKNQNGIISIRVRINIKDVDTLYKKFIPKEYMNGTDTIDQEFKLKITSEGIQDYYYSKGDESKPFTIVKHSWDVGKKWSFTTPDGKTIHREITEKTGKDDWPMGFFFIKTTKIEETNPGVEGITRATYRTNHRFGLVYVEYELVTGQKLTIDMIPKKG
jgi:hypothetical protein